MPEPLVVAERFSYRYPDAARPSLRTLTFEVEPGTFTVLAGNGAEQLLGRAGHDLPQQADRAQLAGHHRRDRIPR